MDKLIDIFAKWEPFGQGLFLVIVMAVLYEVLKLGVVAFRGWPKCDCKEPTEMGDN
mgnify:CR=1 FL=1